MLITMAQDSQPAALEPPHGPANDPLGARSLADVFEVWQRFTGKWATSSPYLMTLND
jgi:hypothetical protein